jgi:tRNA pseudouridine55 synthase
MRRTLDGVLLLDKPAGISSNAALQQAKRLLGAAKAGHAGTLDPLASGLLPLLFGEATKFARFALDSDKTYVAEVRLGVTTATGDAEGEVLERRPVDADDARVAQALERFRGELSQVPPMHSALKRGGRPLYELARAGRTVPREARRVVIHELALLGRAGESLELRVRCSKGTYVRRLAEEIGAALGTGAHLAALRRTAAGGYRVAEAVDLARLQALDDAGRRARLLPPASLLAGLPQVELDAVQAASFALGQAVGAPAQGASGYCRVLASGGALLGVGNAGRDGRLRPVRLLAGAAGRRQAAEIPGKTC